MSTLIFWIIMYLIFAVAVAMEYVFLFHVYYMPQVVKKATRNEKIKVYGSLFLSIFVIAPYGLYEMLRTYKKGGFKNEL